MEKRCRNEFGQKETSQEPAQRIRKDVGPATGDW